MSKVSIRSINMFLLSAFLVAVGFLFGKIELNNLTDQEYKNEMFEKYNIFSLVIPDSLFFAGERVPLENNDIFERMDYEFLKNTYWHSQTLLAIKRATKYFPIIEYILEKNNIPEDFKYLAVIESNLNPIAVSPARASGIWQFLDDTAREYGLEVSANVDERFHLEKGTQAACDYLNEAKEKFGTWTMAAVSYNAGMGGIEMQINQQKINSFYDLYHYQEPMRYIFRIIALKYIMQNPENYGFKLREIDKYKNVDTFKELVDYPIDDLAQWSLKKGINYKLLKHHNPWLISNKLDYNNEKKYYIKLPKKGEYFFNINTNN